MWYALLHRRTITEIDELLCTSFGARRDEAYFNNVKDIKLLGHTEALRINRSEKTVTVQDMQTNIVRDIPYDNLVLGVGANPVVPPIEGLTSKESTGFTTQMTRFR